MHHSSVFSFIFGAAAFALTQTVAAQEQRVYLEIFDVPPLPPPDRTEVYSGQRPEGGLFSGLFGSKDEPTPRTLSAYFASTKEGKKKLKSTARRHRDEKYRIRIFQCRPVLAKAHPGNTKLVIDLGHQRAYFLVNGQMALETPISSGRAGKRTPAGDYSMTERVRDGKISTIYDVEMPFWMRLDHTEFGVHAGYLPGYPASAGCVRLPDPAAKIVFENTRSGSPVEVVYRWVPPATFDYEPARPYAPRRSRSGGGEVPASPRGQWSRPNGESVQVDEFGQTYVRIRI